MLPCKIPETMKRRLLGVCFLGTAALWCTPAHAVGSSNSPEQTVHVASMPPKDTLDRVAIFVSAGVFLVGIGGVLVASLTHWNVKTSSERQLRAYVFPDGADLYDGTSASIGREELTSTPGIAIAFKNTGQTPAYKVVHWIQVAVIPMRDETLQLNTPTDIGRKEMSVGANGTFSNNLWFDRQLTEQEMREIENGTRAIYVYGRIEYVDVFKRQHHTNYRLFYGFAKYPPTNTGHFRYSDEGNDAT